MAFKVNKTEEDWRKELSEEEFHVLRKKGTERPFTGKYDVHFETGIYHCNACGEALFTSESKFDARCGWPSFDKSLGKDKIVYQDDFSIANRPRTEILCGNCGSHLGHVFNDGPTETGQRYCVNSVSLEFKEEN